MFNVRRATIVFVKKSFYSETVGRLYINDKIHKNTEIFQPSECLDLFDDYDNNMHLSIIS